MTEPTRLPPGVEALIRSVVGGAGDEDRDQRASTFARGLALGALVGAAIAGSTIWQRRAAQRQDAADPGKSVDAARADAPGADSV